MRSRAVLHRHLRRSSVDPLGAEVVDLGSYAASVQPRAVATEKAKILLAGAVARARAFGGSRPENLKPTMPTTIDRRSIFTLSLLEYHAVPSVQVDRCRVEQGCALCMWACPNDAMRVRDGEVYLEKSRCTSCGLCVTACPHDALDLPVCAPAQLEEQVTALLDPAWGGLNPRAILFTCAHGMSPLASLSHRQVAYPANWLPVEVPCVEMVPPGWVLASLRSGAAAVGLLSSATGGCAGRRHLLEGRVDYCRVLLRRLGESVERIVLLPTETYALAEALQALPSAARPVPGRRLREKTFAQRSAAQVILDLAGGYGTDGGASLAHPYSPHGVIEMGDGCTLCGACADACPTDALEVRHAEDAVLTFDAAGCVACGLCLPVCPEPGVLRLRQVTGLHSLAAGRVGLHRATYRRCLACGRPVAPDAMLTRIASLLGSQYSAVEGVIANYCQDCRSASGGQVLT